MNCADANKIPISGFLFSKGFHPVTPKGNQFWYVSPLRNEKTASFKVDRISNVWYDYGISAGGHLIDLVCRLYGTGVSGALMIISGLTPGDLSPSFFEKPDFDKPKSATTIQSCRPIQNKSLIRYLISRNINITIAEKYVEEVYYTVFPGQTKPFFAIGFKNDLGGYELRSGFPTQSFPSGFKGASSPKSITTIPGQNRFAVNVFEGFMDCLSAMSYFRTAAPKCDTLVLNSVGLLKHFTDKMGQYTKINLFLDNDAAGEKAALTIQSLRPDAINRSKIIYPGFKDFNDFIIG